MRVTLVSDCYPPRVGGIETQVGDLAHRLVAAGDTVEVVTLAPDAQGRAGGRVEVEDRGSGPVTVHRLGRPLPAGLLWDPRTRTDLRRLLTPERTDVVHAHLGVLSPLAADGVRVALAAGVPVVATWHSRLAPVVPLWRVRGEVAAWARAGARLTAVSSLVAGEVAAAARGAVGGTTEVGLLPNGIDTALWHPAQPVRPTDGTLHVVTTMRLMPRKRPLAALDVLARVPRSVHLTVVGDGPLRPVLEHHARRCGLVDRVTLTGRIPREQVAEHLTAADVFLSTARLEAFGIAALEARACGLPVLARSDSGVRDIVTDGHDGLLPPDDTGLATALTALATDPTLLARLTAGARARPPAQSWESVVAATQAEYAAVQR